MQLYHTFYLVVLVCGLGSCASTQNATSSLMRSMHSFKTCLSNKHPVVCVKERALDALNETIMSDLPMNLFDVLTIERNPDYTPNITEEENLPQEIAERSLKLTDILYDRIEDFFKSRTLKVNLAPAFEGRDLNGGSLVEEDCDSDSGNMKIVKPSRKKSGKSGKGGMMMLGMIGMGCMMAQMMMGKIAFLAGSALIIAKVALFLSAIASYKKMGGGGGGESHIVYTSGGGGGGDYGHSHGGGGGGWHRSLNADDGKIAPITENNISGYRK